MDYQSAGRDQHLALLMVEFAFQLMQLLDNINKDSFQVHIYVLSALLLLKKINRS
jgi:hypothetical protein